MREEYAQPEKIRERYNYLYERPQVDLDPERATMILSIVRHGDKGIYRNFETELSPRGIFQSFLNGVMRGEYRSSGGTLIPVTSVRIEHSPYNGLENSDRYSRCG